MRVLLLIICTVFVHSMYAQDKKSDVYLGYTSGQLPYLEYSDGKVRLGADKMGFLDTAIRLVIIDSLEDRYKVQLADNWQAYIPKRNIANIHKTENKDLFNQLSSSWHLSGKEDYDLLSISFSKRLPYRTMQVNEPNKIIIDVFGATSNTTWFTQLKKVKVVKNVYHEQIEKDVFRVHIELEGKQNWGYKISYRGNALQIEVRHGPKKHRIQDLMIAIDAGHGGSAKGAVSPNGVEEKEYNLKFALELQKLLLKKGVKNVYMTRTEDVEVATTDRVLQLREVRPDLLISLHLNASSNPNVKGVSTYYKHAGSKEVSSQILDEMLKLDLNEFGLIGNFNFLLNSPIEYPNTLVEIAFLSNEEDEKRILDPKFHKQTAEKIYRGVINWLKSIK